MHIYMAGVGGVGIGPLAEIANGAGYHVSGSDLSESLTTDELQSSGVDVHIYPQDGSWMRLVHEQSPIDWFVYTSALPDDHAELTLARELGIRTSKRDELLSYIIEDKKLKLIAVTGTHGKTTTTGMLVWAFSQLGVPVSYSVGSTLTFGPAGLFDEAAEYFVYECDEYDRNFLAFHPHIALITSIDHDHFDTYPTEQSYTEAFRLFTSQSQRAITWSTYESILDGLSNVEFLTTSAQDIVLSGEHNRLNASLALSLLETVLSVGREELTSALNTFPGTGRRFEKLAEGLYTDYGHHPVEIAATLQLASERSDKVVLVYQPHQNGRQHEIQADYTADVFAHADHVYWLPTYLTRENPDQPVLTPEQLAVNISEKITTSYFDDELWQSITQEITDGSLVLCMGAGTIDGWLRQRLAEDTSLLRTNNT